MLREPIPRKQGLRLIKNSPSNPGMFTQRANSTKTRIKTTHFERYDARCTLLREPIPRKQGLRHVGKTYKGIKVTEQGILYMAHLLGPKQANRFLVTKGASDKTDGLGTKQSEYLQLHLKTL